MKQRLKYEEQKFANEREMVEALLGQANERVIRIDLGEFPNNLEERNYIKFRLMHINRMSLSKIVLLEIRPVINSLWSQLYRLEHQGLYTHPYLNKVMEFIQNECKNNHT